MPYCIIGIFVAIHYRLLHYRQISELHYRAYSVTLSVSCYIIGKFLVILSVVVTLVGVVTLSGVTGLVLMSCEDG